MTTATNPRAVAGDNSTKLATDALKGLVERIEKMDEEKQTIAGDIRDVFTEAKANGFDVKALREIIKLRKLEADERETQRAILDLYMDTLGMGVFA